jgi:hypothetical protein
MKLVFAIVGLLAFLAYSAALPFNADMVGGAVNDVILETRARDKRCWVAGAGPRIPNVAPTLPPGVNCDDGRCVRDSLGGIRVLGSSYKKSSVVN